MADEQRCYWKISSNRSQLLRLRHLIVSNYILFNIGKVI